VGLFLLVAGVVATAGLGGREGGREEGREGGNVSDLQPILLARGGRTEAREAGREGRQKHKRRNIRLTQNASSGCKAKPGLGKITPSWFRASHLFRYNISIRSAPPPSLPPSFATAAPTPAAAAAAAVVATAVVFLKS